MAIAAPRPIAPHRSPLHGHRHVPDAGVPLVAAYGDDGAQVTISKDRAGTHQVAVFAATGTITDVDVLRWSRGAL